MRNSEWFEGILQNRPQLPKKVSAKANPITKREYQRYQQYQCDDHHNDDEEHQHFAMVPPNINCNHLSDQIPLVQLPHNYGSLRTPDPELNGSQESATQPPPVVRNDGVKEKKSRRPTLVKIQSTFYEDAIYFNEGSIPHSMVLALVIGVVCGTAACLYYEVLFWSLEFIWRTLPERLVVDQWPESTYVLWIPLIGVVMAVGVGLSVMILGEPGDLPSTIKNVHDDGYVSMSHVIPMVCASQFSIIGGGSLGPEAPLVAICASLAGFISRRIFRITNRNLVRKHTLMGMASALAAFFGCPLGGSLFALEVNSRFGIEYFEHTVEAILAGEVCLVVFRGLVRLPIEPIWDIATPKLAQSYPLDVCYGLFLGLIGAMAAFMFAKLHQHVRMVFDHFNLLRNDGHTPLGRALLGCSVIVLLAMLLPHTMFWGEFEFQAIATMGPASQLEHVWPTSGLVGFEMDSGFNALVVAVTKLIAISFTVHGGYRGGYIFPAMAAGAALGQAVHSILPGIPIQLCCLCLAGAITVAITRTAIATTLILTYLSGDQNCISAILASSLISLFATGYMPFIKSQMTRADIDSSLYQHSETIHI